MKVLFVALALVALLGAACQTRITSFEECVEAGNPVMESFPRQCRANGQLFVEDVPSWQTDGVYIVRNTEGQPECFGCGRGICKDHLAGLEQIPETEAMHCDEDFNLVRG